MRKLLTYVPLQGHLILLALAVLMRLPALVLPDYFLGEESLYLTCGEKINHARLYTEVWFEGPPLVVWIYSLFTSLFGESAITVIRLATALYVYLMAAFFQGALTAYRINERRSNTPGVFFVMLLSLPWYGLALGPSLLSLFPFFYTLILILRLTLDDIPSRSAIFYTGLLLACVILLDYAGLVLTLAALVAYFFLRGPRTQELLTAGLGMVMGLLILTAWLYFTNALGGFIEVGFLTYFRYIFSKAPNPFDPDLTRLLLDVILNYGPFILLGGFGFFHYRVKLFSYVIMARRLESIMFIWLVFGTIILIFSGSRLQILDFALVAAPLAFYAAKAWELRKGFLVKTTVWVILLVPLAVLYLDMISMYQKSWTVLPDRAHGALGIRNIQVEDLDALRSLDLPPEMTLWVAVSKPQLYLLLDHAPATPFIDNRAAYHKLHYINPELSKRAVTDAQLFKAFSSDMPEVIIDRGSVMPRLQERFPTLFGSFTPTEAGVWRVWRVSPNK